MPRLFVKADREGQILAVARVDTLREDQTSPFYDDEDPDVEVVEIKDTAGAFKDMEVIDIHMGYLVDAKKKTLKKKKTP
jgi:hypothetical protein